MSLKIDKVKNFKITELPDTPGVFYFDFVDRSNQLTRIEVALDMGIYDPDKIIHIGRDWSNLIKCKPGLDIADAFKKLNNHYDRHQPGQVFK
jgi:hypothetical protein